MSLGPCFFLSLVFNSVVQNVQVDCSLLRTKSSHPGARTSESYNLCSSGHVPIHGPISAERASLCSSYPGERPGQSCVSGQEIGVLDMQMLAAEEPPGLKESFITLGMVASAMILALGRLRQEYDGYEACLAFIAKSCHKSFVQKTTRAYKTSL